MAPFFRRRAHSIASRIFASFAVVLLSFASVASLSIYQHQRTVATLRLLHDGFLPLSLSISEARATQGAFATMVERTLEGGETAAAEGWLEIARRIRPIALRRALDAVTQAGSLVRERAELAPLTTLRAELEAVLLEYELSEEDFESLASALATRDGASRAAALAGIRVRERTAQHHLARAWQLISERVAHTSRKARDDEQRALGLLLGLGLIALAASVAVTVWAQHVLSPLTRLSARVAAVAHGDFSARIEPHADDEIGRVATEFERMVDALSQRDEQLRRTERLAAMGRLAAHVTHEVRNPLNSIRLNVEMLEEDVAEQAPESAPVLQSIVREVDRLTEITDQYLRLVRLPEPRPRPLELAELVRDVVSFLKQEMEQAGVEVQVDLEDVPKVAADEDQLRQALLNLCRNAREAMPDGGTVLVGTGTREGGALLRVSDSGAGIAEQEREKIFDLFYTTKRHGTGLGLSLTQQVIAAHGGTITCLAAPNGGTAFEIWLPAESESTTPPTHADSPS